MPLLLSPGGWKPRATPTKPRLREAQFSDYCDGISPAQAGLRSCCRGFSRKGFFAGGSQCAEMSQYFLNRSALGSTPAYTRLLRQHCLEHGSETPVAAWTLQFAQR